MKRQHDPIARSLLLTFGLAAAVWGVPPVPVQACTVLVLTDTNRVLFCDNEDWSNPNTRIWFVPAGPKHYGAVYFGFDDGEVQGGVNSEGLAWGAVLYGANSAVWTPDPSLPSVRRTEQALETCATVEEAITFYRGHRWGAFSDCRFLVADRTGASAILRAKDGKLLVEKSTSCQGFGYGALTFSKLLADSAEPTLTNSAQILRACRQWGAYPTQYSYVADLKSGDIFLFPFPGRDDRVQLNLAAELKKGAHYYEMPKIQEQLSQAPRPLLANMERVRLDDFKPIPDKEPKVTAHVRAMLQSLVDDSLHSDDFTPEAWTAAAAGLKEMQPQVKSFGPLVSLNLAARGDADGKRTYRYVFEFEKASLLQRFVFDEQDKLAESETEDFVFPKTPTPR